MELKTAIYPCFKHDQDASNVCDPSNISPSDILTCNHNYRDSISPGTYSALSHLTTPMTAFDFKSHGLPSISEDFPSGWDSNELVNSVDKLSFDQNIDSIPFPGFASGETFNGYFDSQLPSHFQTIYEAPEYSETASLNPEYNSDVSRRDSLSNAFEMSNLFYDSSSMGRPRNNSFSSVDSGIFSNINYQNPQRHRSATISGFPIPGDSPNVVKKTGRSRSISNPSNPSKPRKQFFCHLCPSTFSRNHDLKRHLRIHMGIRPFKCDTCVKTFTRADALYKHVNIRGCKFDNSEANKEHAENSYQD